VGDRIEALVLELGALEGPRAREHAEELVRLLMEFYGAGLARVLELADEARAEGLLERLAADPLVASLLVLHGLHPEDAETRIGRALEGVRPYLGSHGGGVQFLGVVDGVARLRLEGSCDGCPSSLVTVKLAIERAIEEAAPEVVRVEVEGVKEPPPKSPLIQIQRKADLRSEAPSSGEWVTLDPAPEVKADLVAPFDVGGSAIVLLRLGESLYAYRDRCSCGSLLAGAALRDGLLTCPSCERRYDVRGAGRCVDDVGRHLEPLPLLAHEGQLRIAVPASGGGA
jgi:Fe-S cluster biogenesis protein NfuA/nitrite reductase/ring-hydroxylating ferredoxin subunit